MTKMAFPFGIAWDNQMQRTIWNRNRSGSHPGDLEHHVVLLPIQ